MSRLVEILTTMNEAKTVTYSVKDIVTALKKYAKMVEYDKDDKPKKASVAKVAKAIRDANLDIAFAIDNNLAALQKNETVKGSEAISELMYAVVSNVTVHSLEKIAISAEKTAGTFLIVDVKSADGGKFKVETQLAMGKGSKTLGIIFADKENTADAVTVSKDTQFKISEDTVADIIKSIKEEDLDATGFKIDGTVYKFSDSKAEIADAINANQTAFKADYKTIDPIEFGVNNFNITLSLELVD